MHLDLQERRLVVTGAGGSLGPAVVRELAGRGAQVVACDVAEDRLGPAREAGAAEAHGADLLAPGGAEALAAAVGAADGVVHLVGGWRGGTAIAELEDLEDLELLEGLLFRTVVHATRAFAPALRQAGPRGRFALVSSAQAQRPSAGNAAYAATKAAAEAWTLTFGRELAETGGTANVLVVDALTQAPAGERGTATHVDDVAAALAFLCTDAAGAMTAQRLALHGL